MSKSQLGIVLVERLVVDVLQVADVSEEISQEKHGEMPFFLCSQNSRKNNSKTPTKRSPLVL